MPAIFYPEERARMRAAWAIAEARIPDGIQYDPPSKDGIKLQAWTQEEVKERRHLFPGCIWKKHWHEANKWWEYATVFKGVPIRFYGCDQAPPTCKLITEETEVMQDVPIISGYEKKLVKVKKTRVECSSPIDTPEPELAGVAS